MLPRVRFKSASLLKVLLVLTAAMLAICSLALVETMNKAEARSLPQNGKIVFQRFTSLGGNNAGLYTVDPDGSSLSLLSNKAGGPSAWSPDGTKIAYDSIAVMDADGSNNREFRLYHGGTDFEYPTWSPDGTQLAFSTSTPVQSMVPDIYTSHADGSDLTNITKSSDVWESAPSFSPNGRQMCFWGGDHKTGFGINIMNSDGSNPTRLAGHNHNRPVFTCDWSPDGTKIAYSYHPDRGPGYDDVYVMNADGSGKINLTKSPKVSENSPSWSPDGTKITFSSSDRESPSDSDIYTMDADGTDVAGVSTNPDAFDTSPDWQPLPGTTDVHQPDTGGPSLLLVASALLFSGGVLLYAMVRPRM